MDTQKRSMSLAVALSTALTACDGPAPTEPPEDLGPDAATLIVQPSDGDTYWVAAPVPADAEGTGLALAPTSQIVIDFESLSAPGEDFTQLSTYSEDGFTLVNGSSDVFFAFASPQTGNTPFFLGSTTLFNNLPNTATVLTKDDAGAFDVTSIELAELVTPLPPRTVPFTGTRADASTVSVVFTTDGVAGLETFTFSGFTNLTSLSWVQVPPFHQFDNITIGPPDPKDECKNGGWADFGFRNQGLCIQFVNTGKDSR